MTLMRSNMITNLNYIYKFVYENVYWVVVQRCMHLVHLDTHICSCPNRLNELIKNVLIKVKD